MSLPKARDLETGLEEVTPLTRSQVDVKRPFHHVYYQVACTYAVIGEPHQAMAWLERSADTGFPCWPFFKLDPHLENLRKQPEFDKLVSGLEHKWTALKIGGL